jgi:hypothetical protein
MRRLWITLAVVGRSGLRYSAGSVTRIYQERPAIPERVVTTDGRDVVGPGSRAHCAPVCAS